MSLATEIRKHRRQHTFGAYLWPIPKEERERARQRRLNGSEKLEEIQWLLEAGVSCHYIADTIGSTLPAIERLAHRAGAHDIAKHFNHANNY